MFHLWEYYPNGLINGI